MCAHTMAKAEAESRKRKSETQTHVGNNEEPLSPEAGGEFLQIYPRPRRAQKGGRTATKMLIFSGALL